MSDWDGRHWGPYRQIPRRRFPLLRDGVVLALIGALLGAGLARRIESGVWPAAWGLGSMGLFVYALVLGLSQLWRPTRLRAPQLGRLTAVCVGAAVVALVLGLAVGD
ncbi:MAG TPA: hypothetical protein VLD62_06060 [Acidimicrobiia bacterium]|nr:hypothetical protein [Acidimicrobiia bacterium]